MTDLEITKCGTCVGCKLEREMFAFIKRMDNELFCSEVDHEQAQI